MILLRVLCVLCGCLSATCATRRFTPPSGSGQPFPEYQEAFKQATASCRGIRSLTAELRLSGRASGQRVRGRLLAGLAEPASIRLEALSPFGPPAFILAGGTDRATLLLPKDDLVLRNERPGEILQALAGLAIAPDDLRVALTGCATTAGTAERGRRYGSEWAAVEAGDAILYIKDVDARPRIVAAESKAWTIEYAGWLNGLPRRVRLTTRTDPSSRPSIDLAVEVIDLQTNTAIDARAFELEVPRTAQPLTLDELRRIGPLGERTK